MRLLYFAWVRQKLGKGEEAITLPDGVATVSALVSYLCTLGPAYTDAFADPDRLRVAVNQTHKGFDSAVKDDDEIAFFPPVTGG